MDRVMELGWGLGVDCWNSVEVAKGLVVLGLGVVPRLVTAGFGEGR